MRNNIITILDDDCETITPSPNNTTLTLTNTDESSDYVVVPVRYHVFSFIDLNLMKDSLVVCNS